MHLDLCVTLAHPLKKIGYFHSYSGYRNDYHEVLGHPYFKNINKKQLASKTCEPLKKFFTPNPCSLSLIQKRSATYQTGRIGPQTTIILRVMNSIEIQSDHGMKYMIYSLYFSQKQFDGNYFTYPFQDYRRMLGDSLINCFFLDSYTHLFQSIGPLIDQMLIYGSNKIVIPMKLIQFLSF